MAAAAILASALPATAQSQQTAEAAAGPFENLQGTWSGTGIITLGSGDKERIRCRVTYEVERGGSGVDQDLRCASDSYKFELTAKLQANGGNISGFWSERTRSLNGQIVGRASVGQIQAMAETSGFAAALTFVTRGDRQSVRIESKAQEISEVNITLRRTGK
ncbi:MAG: hypothetical protein IT539_00645 [Bradyrhizobiaceae bacterium]|nr:hypothetical protein [Bradyrhizobiaceae bacterium]